jgi:lipid A ethanolaminephosphotransferase
MTIHILQTAKSMLKNCLHYARVRNPIILAVLVSVLITLVGNYTFWQNLWTLPELNLLTRFKLTIGFGVALMSLLMLIQGICLGRYTTKSVALGLWLLTVPAQYFMVSYGVVIDASMLRNALQTDVREVRDLIGNMAVVVAALVMVLPCLWIGQQRLEPSKIFLKAVKRNVLVAIASLLMLVVSLLFIQSDVATLMRSHKSLRYQITPFNVMYSFGRVVVGERKALPFQTLGDAQATAMQPALPVLVLVLGETARSDHFSLNGYRSKNQQGEVSSTTPYLDAFNQHELISFTQVTSCGTNTADSVPCMFSHLDRTAFFSRQANYENLLDVLQKTGYKVLWLDNNSSCKGVCARVPNEDLTRQQHPQHCTSKGCLDEVLIHDLSDRIKTLAHMPIDRATKPALKGIVIVLHPMGSHGPAYYQRSPEALKRFKPECTSSALQQCEVSEVVNAYDNSIVYTDYLLSNAIKQLKALSPVFAPSLIYISDHGESLGENGNYLHGLPYQFAPKVQTHVPLIVWLSDSLAKQRGVDMPCLSQQKDQPLSHHNLFYSVLGLLNVRTAVDQPQLNWFKPCTAP